ncbi:MAG: hypothetical protein Q7Q71_03885 [Verrucomicrobiota bacterium JB023]|nr:hypothetical protein [Verrucomicrobiota bacterium JB023]
MMFDYSQGRTLTEAVDMTFSGDHPCPMCNAIAEAKSKESEDQDPSPYPSDKDDRQQPRHDLKPLESLFALQSQDALEGDCARPEGTLLAAFSTDQKVPSPPPKGLA